MKKIIALLIALMLAFTLVACGDGGQDSEDPGKGEGTPIEGAEITKEQLAEVAAAYNEVAPSFNEMYDAAEQNGWLNDEKTAAEIQVLSATLSTMAKAIADQPSLLDGSNFEEIPGAIRGLQAGIDELAARVSVPYEG